MRIDFGASYKDVSKLLRASSAQTTPSKQPAFENNLRALLAPPSQPTDIKNSLTQPGEQPFQGVREGEDIRGSYRFMEPEQALPDLSSIVPSNTQLEIDKPPAPGVKTPTLLEVRRVDIPGDAPAVSPRLLAKPELKELIVQAGERQGIDPALSMAVVKAESNFNPRAISSDGHASKGLFQLLDSTGKDLLARTGQSGRPYDPFDPDMNVELGTSYLKYLHGIFSSATALPNDHKTTPASDKQSLEKLAVAAFNAGEGRVASAQTRAGKAGKDPSVYEDVAPFLPKSTREYVARVVSNKSAL